MMEVELFVRAGGEKEASVVEQMDRGGVVVEPLVDFMGLGCSLVVEI